MSQKLFISHAVKDKDIATELVRFLEHGLNIPSSEIFCSSIPGEGIPAGEHFVHYIKRELANKDVIVLPLLTANYLQSVFSVCELGATWVLDRKWIPLMLPPLQHKDLSAVLTGVQVHKLDTPEHIGMLRDELAKWCPQPKSGGDAEFAKWEHVKRTFIDRIRDLSSRPLVMQTLDTYDPDDHDVAHSIEFYDKVAQYYDRGVSADFIQTHRALNRTIRKRISSQAMTKILDLGGGTGKILSAFDTTDNLSWFYCDASSHMLDEFKKIFGKSHVVKQALCKDAEDYLREDGQEYDIIILSFLISSMSYLIDFNLLKRRLADNGLLIIVEANPTYSESKPKFTIEDKVSKKYKYSLKIKPVDAPTLATRAELVGFKIKELTGYEKGNQPYSYIGTFAKT